MSDDFQGLLCPLCGETDKGKKVYSSLVFEAFGGDGSSHESCLEEVCASLREIAPAHPETWHEILRETEKVAVQAPPDPRQLALI